jgi:guanidinopropionase
VDQHTAHLLGAVNVSGTDLTAMQLPRYSGIPTFMRVPACTDLAQLDIALAGVPFDGGVTARPGARYGPREIRNMSTMMRTTHHVTRFNPFDACRIGDIGDVPFTDLYHLERDHDDIPRFFEPVFAAGKIPLTAGGDHSITYPIFQAMALQEPVALVHIDAPTDTWDSSRARNLRTAHRSDGRWRVGCSIRIARSRRSRLRTIPVAIPRWSRRH